MARGIDYGMGMSNVDRETGIRYGVIPIRDLSEWAHEDFEADYGDPTCGQCGNGVVAYDEELHGEYSQTKWGCDDWACETCRRTYDSGEVYGEEPLSHNLDDGEYVATLDQYNDIFILKSPYFTRAGFCSPCAPGAGHLNSICDDGVRTYCFGHDWFDGGRAPYPVYSVATEALVSPESNENGK
jgi:hypothetical protein